MFDQLAQLFFFYKTDEFLLARADYVQTIAWLYSNCVAGIRWNDNLSLRSDGCRPIQFLIVRLHYVLLYKKYEMYVKYVVSLKEFGRSLQK